MNVDDPKQRPRNVLPDLVIPLLALVFTGYYLTTITEVPWIAQASAIVVSCLLVAAIVAYIFRTAYRIKRGSEVIALPGPPRALDVSIRRAGLIALTIAYVALIDSLGFTLTISAFIFLGPAPPQNSTGAETPNKLLHGPSLPDAANSQDDIDALLASFD